MNIKLIAVLLLLSLALNIYLGYSTLHLKSKEEVHSITLKYNQTLLIKKGGEYSVSLYIKNKNIVYVNAIMEISINHHRHTKDFFIELNSNQTHRIIHLNAGLYLIKITYLITYKGNIPPNNTDILINITYNTEN
ncbi:hypothetical protein [Sulfurisphaera ohwakuensis]|uniref:hypothetical protein n=1 Tax=Sulfurisphaera ohwakuensis TaxID=69656 RepID=UPI0036F32CF3